MNSEFRITFSREKSRTKGSSKEPAAHFEGYNQKFEKKYIPKNGTPEKTGEARE